MNKNRIILSLPFLALSSCAQSVAVSSGMTSKDLADAHDLASCFSLLARCNDMTMNVIHDSKSSYSDYNRYYTPTYVYDAEEKNEWGYVLGKNGVFSISKDHGAFVTTILNAFPLYKDPMHAIFSRLYDPNKISYDKYLTACDFDCYAYAAEGAFILNAFSYGIQFKDNGPTYQYVVNIQIGGIGTSAFAPIDNANITFPA